MHRYERFSLYGVAVPNESSTARHLSIERVVLATLSTGANETGRAAVHTTVARLEPLFSSFNGYPLSNTIMYAFNASGIHAHSWVYISSHRHLVAADWLLGKFGRRQLLENIAWWFAQVCAMMASRKASVLIAGDAEGSEVLKTAQCIDLATTCFGSALYYSTDTEYFTADKRRAVNTFLHGLTLQTQSSLKVITWIDERTRRIMERKLRDLRVLAWLEQLQSSADPGLDQSSGFFSNFWEDPKKLTVRNALIGEAKKMLRLARGALTSREPKARSHLLHEPCRARFALPDPATAESSATAFGRNPRRQALFPQSPSKPDVFFRQEYRPLIVRSLDEVRLLRTHQKP
ncbi:hypothetical protein V5799_005628 [Amblyomma americanum]|uniref:Uncharacterized protein n=1 Tax=Amblyomma americanum TaxID=6943 RepID=A0AAQ4DYP6_AMBAM